jgi:hypothetical protein
MRRRGSRDLGAHPDAFTAPKPHRLASGHPRRQHLTDFEQRANFRAWRVMLSSASSASMRNRYLRACCSRSMNAQTSAFLDTGPASSNRCGSSDRRAPRTCDMTQHRHVFQVFEGTGADVTEHRRRKRDFRTRQPSWPRRRHRSSRCLCSSGRSSAGTDRRIRKSTHSREMNRITAVAAPVERQCSARGASHRPTAPRLTLQGFEMSCQDVQ